MKIELDRDEIEILYRGLICIRDELYSDTQIYGEKLTNLIKRFEDEYQR